MPKISEKIGSIEKAIAELALLHKETQEELKKLSEDVRDFKEWSKQNIAELREISRGLKEESERFHNEMEEFKEWSKQNIAEIRENSKRFEEWSKQNIAEIRKESERFHNEMEEFKEWSKQNIAEIRENSKRFEEWSKQNIAEIRKESERFHNEMEKFKEWSKQNIKEMRENHEKFAKEMQEFKEWSKQNIRDLNKKWGDLANKMGTVVEDIIAPALPEIISKYFDCEKPISIAQRIVKRKPSDLSKVREFDVIVDCGDVVILNETKSNPNQKSAQRFVEFIRSGEFFEYFPEYKGKKLIPIFSTLNMPDNVKKYLSKNNVYAMGMKGEYMDILNFDDVSLT